MQILIVKTSALGDILHTFPILDYLQEHFPEANVDWVVEGRFAQLVRRHPLVRRTLEIDSRGWRKNLWKGRKGIGVFKRELQEVTYDWLFDLQGNCKSGLVTWLAKAVEKVGFGRGTVPEWPNLLVTKRRYNPPRGRNIREDYLYLVAESLESPCVMPAKRTALEVTAKERTEVDQFLAHPSLQGGRTLVCPGSAWPNKRLAVDQLVTLCTKMEGRFVWLWGSDEERGVAHQLLQHFGQRSRIAPKLSLPALQYLITQVDLVVTMDSLPLHLCALTDTPSYSLFGPSLAAKYAPLGEQHRAVQGECPYGRVFTKRCPKLRSCPTGLCMKGPQLIQPPPKTRSPS